MGLDLCKNFKKVVGYFAIFDIKLLNFLISCDKMLLTIEKNNLEWKNDFLYELAILYKCSVRGCCNFFSDKYVIFMCLQKNKK